MRSTDANPNTKTRPPGKRCATARAAAQPAVSVRPWDHQLRQAVLLAAPYEIVADAPIEAFLHRTNTLDTLGDDEPETPCWLGK